MTAWLGFLAGFSVGGILGLAWAAKVRRHERARIANAVLLFLKRDENLPLGMKLSTAIYDNAVDGLVGRSQLTFGDS